MCIYSDWGQSAMPYAFRTSGTFSNTRAFCFVTVCSICVRPTFMIKLVQWRNCSYTAFFVEEQFLCLFPACSEWQVDTLWMELWRHIFGSLISKSLVCKVHGYILNRAWCVYCISWFYVIDGQYLSPSTTTYRFSFLIWTASCERKSNQEGVQRNTKPR